MKLISISFLLCVFNFSYAQNNIEKWQIEPFTDLGFTENKGRFENIMDEEILYYAEYAQYKILFSNTSFIFGKPEKLSVKQAKERRKKIERGEQIQPLNWNYFKITFLNANQSTQIQPTEIKHHTRNFPDPNNSRKTLKLKAYNGLTFKNIYPNIDLVLELPKKGGLKYSFNVHPSGNYQDILMQYTNINVEKNIDGNLKLINPIDKFIDHAPISFSNNQEIKTQFIVEDNTVRFKLDNFDTSQDLIIDPWIETVLPFDVIQKGYDICFDNYGNCAIIGGDNDEVAFYNSTGVLEWTWDFGDFEKYHGDITSDPITGNLFATLGFVGSVIKLDFTGVELESHISEVFTEFPYEYWRSAYDNETDQLFIATGAVITDVPADHYPYVSTFEPDLTGEITYSDLPSYSLIDGLFDVALLELDPAGDYFYFLLSGAVDDEVLSHNNRLYKMSKADPSLVVWEDYSDLNFEELGGTSYVNQVSEPYYANGFNGLASAAEDFLYSYNGQKLVKRNKDTGERIDSLFTGDTPYAQGGIDVDLCGNVYVGTADSILIINSDFEKIGGYLLVGACYDIQINNSSLYACGDGFVTEILLDSYASPDLIAAPTTCDGCTGLASISIDVACGDFIFDNVSWSPSGETTEIITGLCAGWHVATITLVNLDGDETIIIDSVEVISEETEIIVDIVITDEICVEACNGSVTFTPTTGEAPYSFTLEAETNATGVFTDLCEGSYIILITDANECTYTDTIEIAPGDLIFLIEEEVEEETCAGSCNGNLILTPLTGESPFSFDLEGEINATGVFSSLCGGIYYYTVTDNIGCEFSDSILIETGQGLGLAIFSISQPTCYGFADGSITVETNTEIDSVSYTWFPDNPIGGATFNTLEAGTYLVIATNGICADTLEIILDEPDSIYIDLRIVNTPCFGDSTGVVVIDSVYNAQGDLDNIAFFWVHNFFGDEGVGIDSAYNMPPGEYTVTVNDDNGCSQIIDFTIGEHLELFFSELGFDPAYCRLYEYQSGNGVVYAAASGGAPDYTYEWKNLETEEITDATTWGGLNPGTYQITATDENGCTLIEIIELDSVNPIAAFSVISDQLDENCEGTELVIVDFINQSQYFANPNNPTADTTFFMNMNTPIANWTITHDYFKVFDTTYIGEAIYPVCLVAMNKNGCRDTTCKDIIVHIQPKFIAPNIFSPGDNGINNEFTFEFLTIGIETFKCTIINRWGVTVAEINDITDSWDGTDRNGNECSDGVYFYVYEAVSTNKTAFNGQGTVQLVRR